MPTTDDRYREAGMPPPRDEGSPIPHDSPLDEREHDPATNGPVLPDLPASAYGSDSVPLESDADTTEETS